MCCLDLDDIAPILKEWQWPHTSELSAYSEIETHLSYSWIIPPHITPPAEQFDGSSILQTRSVVIELLVEYGQACFLCLPVINKEVDFIAKKLMQRRTGISKGTGP